MIPFLWNVHGKRAHFGLEVKPRSGHDSCQFYSRMTTDFENLNTGSLSVSSQRLSHMNS